MPKKVIIRFNLLEDVTPELFAEHVISAVTRGGTIRRGESITVFGSDGKPIKNFTQTKAERGIKATAKAVKEMFARKI